MKKYTIVRVVKGIGMDGIIHGDGIGMGWDGNWGDGHPQSIPFYPHSIPFLVVDSVGDHPFYKPDDSLADKIYEGLPQINMIFEISKKNNLAQFPMTSLFKKN
jgi:hypothetical protein